VLVTHSDLHGDVMGGVGRPLGSLALEGKTRLTYEYLTRNRA